MLQVVTIAASLREAVPGQSRLTAGFGVKCPLRLTSFVPSDNYPKPLSSGSLVCKMSMRLLIML